jgi:hypothetical protein
MSIECLHESAEVLSETTKTLHRAIVSLIEELEAIDWYTQRAEACGDDELRSVLVHNRNEEVEHAMMVLEWIRRHDSAFATNLDKYLHSNGPITGVESGTSRILVGKEASASSAQLGIGSLKGQP